MQLSVNADCRKYKKCIGSVCAGTRLSTLYYIAAKYLCSGLVIVIVSYCYCFVTWRINSVLCSVSIHHNL